MENYDSFQDNNDFEIQEGRVENLTIEELLISLVQVRPPLWNSRLPLKDRSKTIRDTLWLEIYKDLGEQEQYSVEFLVKKWRNLRDTYVRVKGEYEAYTHSGSEAIKKKKKWQFYDMMSFLNDTLDYRPTTSHLANTSESVSTSPSSSDTSRKRARSSINTEEAIIGALNRINTTSLPAPVDPTTGVNPICLRISEMLATVPSREKAELEIKLLQIAYDGAKEYL